MNQRIPHLKGLLSASFPGSDLLRSPQQEAVVGRLWWEEGPMKTHPSPAVTSHPEGAGTESKLATNKPGRFKKARQGLTIHLRCARERLKFTQGLLLLQLDGFLLLQGDCGSS